MELQGKVVLVTGGARGIGREIASLLGLAGARVGIVYRNSSAGCAELRDWFAGKEFPFAAVRADISVSADADRAIEETEEALGPLDALVNNSGVAKDNLLATMSDAEIQEVVGTNLIGTMFVTRAAIRKMISRRTGRILNISSVAAQLPGRGQSNYAASKGGIEAFTRAMAVELAPRGILVNNLAPGVVDTEMSAEIRLHAEEEILRRLLVKRFATAAEIAEAAVWILRQDYMTGETISLNGGMKRG